MRFLDRDAFKQQHRDERLARLLQHILVRLVLGGLVSNVEAAHLEGPATISDGTGKSRGQVQLRFYAGKFAAPKSGSHEGMIREWCAAQRAGVGPIEVFCVTDVVEQVRRAAAQSWSPVAARFRPPPTVAAFTLPVWFPWPPTMAL